MPLDRMWSIIRNLPPGSALERKVNPEQWRAEHYILAYLADTVLFTSTSKPEHGPDPRKAYPRPGDAERQRVEDEKVKDVIRESRERFRRQLEAGGDV